MPILNALPGTVEQIDFCGCSKNNVYYVYIIKQVRQSVHLLMLMYVRFLNYIILYIRKKTYYVVGRELYSKSNIIVAVTNKINIFNSKMNKTATLRGPRTSCYVIGLN